MRHKYEQRTKKRKKHLPGGGVCPNITLQKASRLILSWYLILLNTERPVIFVFFFKQAEEQLAEQNNNE